MANIRNIRESEKANREIDIDNNIWDHLTINPLFLAVWKTLAFLVLLTLLPQPIAGFIMAVGVLAGVGYVVVSAVLRFWRVILYTAVGVVFTIWLLRLAFIAYVLAALHDLEAGRAPRYFFT